jgi:hypothetical protein
MIQLAVQFLYLKEDTLKYLIVNGQKPQSFRVIAQIYAEGRDIQTAEQIIR